MSTDPLAICSCLDQRDCRSAVSALHSQMQWGVACAYQLGDLSWMDDWLSAGMKRRQSSNSSGQIAHLLDLTH